MTKAAWIDRRMMLGGLAAALASPSLAVTGDTDGRYDALRKTIDCYLRQGLAPHMLVAVGRDGTHQNISLLAPMRSETVRRSARTPSTISHQ